MSDPNNVDADEIEAIFVEDDEPVADADGGAVLPDAAASAVGEAADGLSSVDGILTVPIEVVIAVGKAKPLIRDFVNMQRDSLIVLDSKIDDPVEILVAGRTIARGELQELADEDGMLAVRLTEIVAREDR